MLCARLAGTAQAMHVCVCVCIDSVPGAEPTRTLGRRMLRKLKSESRARFHDVVAGREQMHIRV